MSTLILWIIVAILLIVILAVLIQDRLPKLGKRPAPQQPPSDRSKFDAIKRDWEGKQ